MVINVISSKDSDEIRKMHTKGDSIENMMVSETGEVIKEHFETILQIYQKIYKNQ